jgi:hypothetical protein
MNHVPMESARFATQDMEAPTTCADTEMLAPESGALIAHVMQSAVPNAEDLARVRSDDSEDRRRATNPPR